jgi:hypothetical protein
MIKTRDGPEDFALGSLAAAGCPEENKGLILVWSFADHGVCQDDLDYPMEDNGLP